MHIQRIQKRNEQLINISRNFSSSLLLIKHVDVNTMSGWKDNRNYLREAVRDGSSDHLSSGCSRTFTLKSNSVLEKDLNQHVKFHTQCMMIVAYTKHKFKHMSLIKK